MDAVTRPSTAVLIKTALCRVTGDMLWRWVVLCGEGVSTAVVHPSVIGSSFNYDSSAAVAAWVVPRTVV